MELEQVVETVEVPRNTGVDGFIQLLRGILKLGRVQDVHITGNGRVTYKYLVPQGMRQEALNPEQLFEQVSPAYLIRNSTLRELRVTDGDNSLETLFHMARAARLDSVEPLAWAVGADTLLPEWLAQRSSLNVEHTHPLDVMMGLPVLKDRMLPDESLTLCAGPRRGGDLVDTTHAYKIAMVLP